MGNTDKFDSMAEHYDSEERIKIAEISANAIREALKTKEKSLNSAMDFGCGTGLVGLALLDLFDSMVFLDSSENMIEVVKRKVIRLDNDNIDYLHLDLEKGDEINRKVEVIFMAQVLLHIPNYQVLLEKLYCNLESDGLLVIVDFDKNDNVHSDLVHSGFDQLVLKDILHQIGFQRVSSHTFYNGEKLFMKEDASMFIMVAQR